MALPFLDMRYNRGYTTSMKTAISVPDPVFDRAEGVSKRLGLSRSTLYSKALEAFLSSHRTSGVRAALDAVYKTEDSEQDPTHTAMQMASILREDW
jgi:hypothetical protein